MKQKSLQRITTLLLALLMLPQAAWALQGKGTEASPYLVEYGAELNTIRIEISQGKWADGVYIKLVNDIALTDSYLPLGTTSYPFKGHFNGNYHKITGLALNYTTGNQGMFAVTQNCNIEKFSIAGTMTSSTSGLSNIGSVVGCAKEGTQIYGVKSTVNISINGVAQKHIGGIVGHYEGGQTSPQCCITRCEYGGVINAGTSTDCIGGILGFANNTTNAAVLQSNSTGSIYSTGSTPYMGGILGYNNNENKKFGGIQGCFSRCGLHYTGSNKYVSGIGGRIRNNADNITNNCALTDSCGGKLFNTDSDATFSDTNELVTYAQCRSGYVTYKLNPTQDLLSWNQKLNSDNYPYIKALLNTSANNIVYKVQDKKCTGANYGSAYYSNSNSYTTHHNGSWVERVEPTCTTTGKIRHYHCNDCGKNFSSETGTNEITDITLAALGHDLKSTWEWSDDAHSATCTDNCIRSGCSHSANATATYPDGGITRTLVSAATCAARASYKYTATCTVNGNKRANSKTVEEGNKLPHNFSGGECTVCHEGDYLTFTSTGSTTISLLNYYDNAPNVEYSLDDGATWATWDYSYINLAKGEKVKMRGDNPHGFSNPEDLDIGVPYSCFAIIGKTAASGSVMSLIDGHGTQKVIPSRRCFFDLFSTCELTTAPQLLATTLTDNCYEDMFSFCTPLTTAPTLPADSLATECYYSMFRNCPSLTTAPALPATKLAENCYTSMFSSCTALTTAPELPATKLARSCYDSMFSSCTALAQAPALPADSLASECYYSMFSKCTSLTQAPALPADSLASECYYSMFSNCTSLTQAPALPATKLAKYCYYDMFSSCTALTQAPALPATKLDDFCYTNMFKGCTALAQAPELPATTLAKGCYRDMFNGCGSLTTAPKLPADSLVEDCYKNMFNGCSKLSKVEVNFTEWSVATRTWLVNVAATGEFICPSSLPQTRGTSNIPEGWTITVKAPAYANGDVNGDGNVDIVAIYAVINVVMGNATNESYGGRADVNGDGDVDIVDVNAIINIILDN